MTESSYRPMVEFTFDGKKYQSAQSSIAITPHFVCFMDLLGTKFNISHGDDREFLDGFYCVLDVCKQIQKDYPDLKIKTFSDNICFFCQIPPDISKAKGKFIEFLRLVSCFQIALLVTTAELVRGGIASGEGYCDDLIAWGKALVKASELERDAIYPRIVLDKESCTPYLSDRVAKYCLSNENGLLYLDWFALSDGEEYDANILQVIQQRLAEKIKRSLKSGNEISEGMFSKLSWAVRFCNQKAKQLGRADLILCASVKLPNGEGLSLFADAQNE